ncbi:MAG: hypothetical protein ACR2IK_18000 [Chloroflexota bacterium]
MLIDLIAVVSPSRHAHLGTRRSRHEALYESAVRLVDQPLLDKPDHVAGWIADGELAGAIRHRHLRVLMLAAVST